MKIDDNANKVVEAMKEHLNSEPLHSTKVDLASHTHFPSNDKFDDLDKVMSNLLLQHDDLDPNLFYKEELNNRSKSVNINKYDKKELDQLFQKVGDQIDLKAKENETKKIHTEILN